MTREPQTKCERGSAAVRGDRHRRAQLARRSVVANRHTPDDPARGVDRCAADAQRWFEAASRGERALQQQPVEIAPQDCAAVEVVGIAPFDRDAAFAGHQHPVDAQSVRVDDLTNAEPI